MIDDKIITDTPIKSIFLFRLASLRLSAFICLLITSHYLFQEGGGGGVLLLFFGFAVCCSNPER